MQKGLPPYEHMKGGIMLRSSFPAATLYECQKGIRGNKRTEEGMLNVTQESPEFVSNRIL